MKNCEDCKTWAKLVHQMLPSLWGQQERVKYLLNKKDREIYNRNITMLEQKVLETLG